MLGVALLAGTIAGCLLAIALFSAAHDQRVGAECLVGALQASGSASPAVARLGFRRRVRVQAALGPHRLDAYHHPAGLGGAASVTLVLDAGLDPSLNLQIHFGEQTSWVLGEEALGAALSSGQLRGATSAGDQLHLADGTVSLLLSDPARASAALAALEQIAARLRAPGTTVDSLLEHTALEDPDPRARAEAIGILLGRRPELAESISRDREPEVRLAVARVIRGELGFRLAAEILTSEIFHVEIQQAALRYLLSAHGPEQVGPVLVDALSGADDNLQGALVTAIDALGHSGAVHALHSALPTAELANAARIAEALAALEGAEAEPALIELLDRLPSSGPGLTDERELAATIADALGRIGTQASLSPLRSLALTVPPEGPVGIAVKVALDLVRTRTGASADWVGALALSGASPVEGRLSRPHG